MNYLPFFFFFLLAIPYTFAYHHDIDQFIVIDNIHQFICIDVYYN